MTRDRTILALGIAVVIAAAILSSVGEQIVWLRTLVGIPFILLLPGGAAMLLIDPDARLGVSEWVTLCVGVSISISMLVGMGLALTLGLNTVAITLALTILTLGILVLAAMKSPASTGRHVTPKRRSPIRRIGAGALALLVCAVIALVMAVPDPFTARNGNVVQLWGLPDASGGVRIGTSNINADSTRFHLAIRQNGRTIAVQNITLLAGTSHLFDVKSTALVSTDTPVTAELSDRSGVAAPRTISVWTNE